jgi:hypothetical protein
VSVQEGEYHQYTLYMHIKTEHWGMGRKMVRMNLTKFHCKHVWKFTMKPPYNYYMLIKMFFLKSQSVAVALPCDRPQKPHWPQ